jgi:hypothetical protein
MIQSSINRSGLAIITQATSYRISPRPPRLDNLCPVSPRPCPVRQPCPGQVKMSSRAWCLTINDYVGNFMPDELPVFQYERYVVWQLERAPTTGRCHIQAYIEFERPVRRFAIMAVVACHAEPRAGPRDAARDYCRKEETRVEGPFERGTWIGGQGSRNDLKAAIETLKAASPSKRLRAVAMENPEAFVKFSRGLRELADELVELPRDAGFVPRPWQGDLLLKLQVTPDDRKIFWVTDAVGGKGKSRLARYLILEKNAIQLSGKVTDMQFAYSENKARIVVFDVSRAQAEFSDHLYSMAEMLKNGVFMNSKYKSKQVVFKPPHVVFFSNASWDRTKFSVDRVVEIIL